jgi:hypothetical protein
MKTKRKFKSVKYVDENDKHYSFNDLVKAFNDGKTLEDILLKFKIENNEL